MAAHSSRTAVDAVDSTAEAPGSVFDSIKQGATELQVSAYEALPATGRFLGRVIYNTSYVVAFGVTFPVLMIVRVVPKDNALVHGLVDGALAARDRVDGWRGEIEEDHPDTEDDGSDASDNGTAHDEESPVHATHRRPKAKRAATRKTTRSSSRKKS
jgi:hypothetical protein